MGNRGPKPHRKVKIKWSADFAYAIGLIATDGCVYSDGLHVNLTSKDIEQIENFKKAFNIDNQISKKARASESEKKYYLVQFGDVLFVKFLKSIGITSAKSKILKKVLIPDEYFFDFLRGCFDGDGTFYSYWDKRWKSSFMHYLAFASASKEFINWLQEQIYVFLNAWGHVTVSKSRNCWQLRYAKSEGLKIIRKMYKKREILFLSRKRLKINAVLAMIGQSKV